MSQYMKVTVLLVTCTTFSLLATSQIYFKCQILQDGKFLKARTVSKIVALTKGNFAL